MSDRPTANVHPAALAITLFSLLAWGLFVPLRTHHAFHDLDNGTFTDHFSHLNAARIFPRIGLDIWRAPIDRQFRRLSPQELQAMPPQLRYQGSFFVPGWPADKPLQQSWSHIPRLYPPGDMLLVAPLALAYHFTPLSAGQANLLLILLFLAFAHAGLLLALDAAFRTDGLAAPLGLFGALVVYGELVRWSGAGFYDAAGVFPLILCARYLKERRGLAALCAYCAAAFLHFRAFYLAPWAVYSGWLIVRDRQWRRWARWDFLSLGVALICAVCSLGSFALLWPTLRSLVEMNPLARMPVLLAFWFFWLLCGAVFLRARAWLDLAVLLWLGFFFPLQHHIFNWYVVLLLPWLAAPVGEAVKEKFRWVGEARLVAFIVASGYIYDRFPMPWTWLPQLVLFQN
jgi:hypothetical protein